MSWTDLLSWLISVLVLVTLVAFIGYVVGLRALPVEGRPRTAIYDRLGRQIGETENPDFHVNPGEDKTEKPDNPE